GDDGDSQRMIKTVHGRGIRFVSELIESAAPPVLAHAPSSASAAVAAVSPEGRIVASGRPSVSVVPLRAAGDADIDRYFAKAVTEEIVTCLARDRVVAVSVAFAPDRPEALGADSRSPSGTVEARYRLEGAVRCSIDRLVLTLRLIDMA